MKKLTLLLFLLGCADEYREVHTVSFNGSLPPDKAGLFTVRSHYGKVNKNHEYARSNSGAYNSNCEKIIHRAGRSYLVPCDY